MDKESYEENVENYLSEIQSSLETGIRSCKTEKEVERYYNFIMNNFVGSGKVTGHKFGKAELGEEYIAITFAYRPNIEYFHVNNLQEQPRMIFQIIKERKMSLDDLLEEIDDEEEFIEEDNEKEVSTLLEEVENIFEEG